MGAIMAHITVLVLTYFRSLKPLIFMTSVYMVCACVYVCMYVCVYVCHSWKNNIPGELADASCDIVLQLLCLT